MSAPLLDGGSRTNLPSTSKALHSGSSDSVQQRRYDARKAKAVALEEEARQLGAARLIDPDRKVLSIPRTRGE